MTNARARRFSPIFAATITPDTVEPLTTVKGKDYTRCAATISRNGKPDEKRTVLAFGKAHDTVSPLLVAGKPIELAIQMDGGSAKIIGLPRAKVVPIATDEHNPGPAYVETVIADISAILWLVGIDDSLHEDIIHSMLTGESEAPADEGEAEDELRALVHETQGHILFPLLDAGVDYALACRTVDLIREIPAAAYLDDMRRFREQTAVLGLLDAA